MKKERLQKFTLGKGFHWDETIVVLALVASLIARGDEEIPRIDLVRNGDFSSVVWTSWIARGAPQQRRLAVVKVNAGPYRRALRFVVARQPDDNDWEVCLTQPVDASLDDGAPLVLKAWMRSPERCPVRAYVEMTAKPWAKSPNTVLTLTPEWQEYEFRGPSVLSFEPGECRVGFHLAHKIGTIELTGIRLLCPARQGRPESPDDSAMERVTPVRMPWDADTETQTKGNWRPMTPEQLDAELKAKNPELTGRGNYIMYGDTIGEAGLMRRSLTDLSPLEGLPLSVLWCNGNPVENIGSLAGMPLQLLGLNRTKVADITPLASLPLRVLHLNFTSVAELEPLAKAARLESLWIGRSPVDNLEPLRDMPLRELICFGTSVSDLTPLRGMPLQVLDANFTKVEDLSPLRGHPLRVLRLAKTPVTDLSPLSGMPLEILDLNDTGVTDLQPLHGAPLTVLACRGTKVSDLTPLSQTELRELTFDPAQVGTGWDMIRGMTSLETINGVPAAEFWRKLRTNNGAAPKRIPSTKD